MVLSCLAIVFCCFLSISVCDLMVVLKSLNSVLWLFSSVASLVFSLLMSARMDFGIPDVFGMAICSFDEKKSIPHGSEMSVYRTKSGVSAKPTESSDEVLEFWGFANSDKAGERYL